MAQINILGTRGIPAAHGGFETFAGQLAPFLRDRGHRVTVYCQAPTGQTPRLTQDVWQGIERVHIAPRQDGPRGTVEMDWTSLRHALRRPGIDLVLGYNTAILHVLPWLRGRRVLINMDGIEWKRQKWSWPARAWLWTNEKLAATCCTHPIADHPEIARHVQRRTHKRPLVIPYGADAVTQAPTGPVTALGLTPGRYFLCIARPEPENSILFLVRAFEQADLPDCRLVVLGTYRDDTPYHRQVRGAAGARVLFPGAIYDPAQVTALRRHALAYVHGHQVGGTNPSLVESLAAGRPILAHDNRFNRWTAGWDQMFFTSVDQAAQAMTQLAHDPTLVQTLSLAAKARHQQAFQLEAVLSAYENALLGRPVPTHWATTQG